MKQEIKARLFAVLLLLSTATVALCLSAAFGLVLYGLITGKATLLFWAAFAFLMSFSQTGLKRIYDFFFQVARERYPKVSPVAGDLTESSYVLDLKEEDDNLRQSSFEFEESLKQVEEVVRSE